MLDLTHRIVRSLVDQPDLVRVAFDGTGDGACRILVRAAPGELRQVIGRQGWNLEALRRVVQCAGKYGCRAQVEVLDPAWSRDGVPSAASGRDRR